MWTFHLKNQSFIWISIKRRFHTEDHISFLLKWLIASSNKIYIFNAFQNCCFKKVEKFQNQTFLARFSMSQKNFAGISLETDIFCKNLAFFCKNDALSCKILQKIFQESCKACLTQWLGLLNYIILCLKWDVAISFNGRRMNKKLDDRRISIFLRKIFV